MKLKEKIPVVILGLTSLLCALGGWYVYKEMSGNSDNSDIRFIHAALVPLLGLSGTISAALGANGYLRGRRDKKFTPLLVSLNGLMGALAILIALFFVFL